MGILQFVKKKKKKNGIPIFPLKNALKNWKFPFFVSKLVKLCWNSFVFFTLATKKWSVLLGIPNEKLGENFWDSHAFSGGVHLISGIAHSGSIKNT